MNKTAIEWCDVTWNCIKGKCTVNCKDIEGKPYCYARKFYDRFKWDPTIRLDHKELNAILKLKKPSRIFVNSTIEMLLPKIDPNWINEIIKMSKLRSQHTYIMLTKKPNHFHVTNIFPHNWWIGVSIDRIDEYWMRWISLKKTSMVKNNINFISFEPLLSFNKTKLESLFDHAIPNWIIIGGKTPKPVHQREWIIEIVKIASKYNVPVFIKPNANYHIKIEHFPK